MSKSPLSMTLIKKSHINLSGARNLTELLEIYVPGFQYSINAWNGIQWGMRGVSNDRNTKFLVLVNGHKMNTESKDGYIAETDLGLLGDVERVEVLRGPAGLVYGSGAIAGIVNIVTRTDESNKTEVSATLGAQGSFDKTSKTYDIRSFYVPAPGHRLAVSLGWKESDGTGDGRTRQYAKNEWPFCSWCVTDSTDDRAKAGTPVDGSYGYTPGNWRASIDYQWKDLRVYGRMSHQYFANSFFVYDPWPNNNMNMNSQWATDSTLPSVMIDGRSVSFDDPFWANTESWGNQRNAYIADNISLTANWEKALGENKLKLEAAFDGATNRSQKELRQGYTQAAATERAWADVNATFGERRYSLGAIMLWNSLIPKTQLATGVTQRFDDLGKDLTGRNFGWGDPDHPAIAEKLYTNTAVFTEGMTDFQKNLALGYGLRWDGHTRTIEDGGTVNAKTALVFTPVEGHSIKLIAQTSTNNGTIDNYEYNANFYDNDGKFLSGDPEFKNPHATPTNASGVADSINGLKDTKYVVYTTEKDLHSLKPERVYSYELTSSHNIKNMVFLSPSVSYNTVQNLFAWAQNLSRVINAGEYHHLDIDFEARLETKFIDVGVNHSIQIPINTKLKDLGDSIELGYIDTTKAGWYESYTDKDGKTAYRPLANATEKVFVNPAGAMLISTEKGEGAFGLHTHFRGMHTNVTKGYVDIKPTSWMTLHSDLRVFWGLVGRTEEYASLDSMDFQTWDFAEQFSAKWNAGAIFSLPNNLNASFHVFNILGSDNAQDLKNDQAIHAMRWGNGNDNSLWGVDLRSYAVKLEKSF